MLVTVLRRDPTNVGKKSRNPMKKCILKKCPHQTMFERPPTGQKPANTYFSQDFTLELIKNWAKILIEEKSGHIKGLFSKQLHALLNVGLRK